MLRKRGFGASLTTCGLSYAPTRLAALARIVLQGALPESLRWDAQRSVELAGGVLPGHDLGQLNQRVLVEVGPQPREEIVRDVAVGDRDAVGVLQDQPLDVA